MHGWRNDQIERHLEISGITTEHMMRLAWYEGIVVSRLPQKQLDQIKRKYFRIYTRKIVNGFFADGAIWWSEEAPTRTLAHELGHALMQECGHREPHCLDFWLACHKMLNSLALQLERPTWYDWVLTKPRQYVNSL